MSDFDRYYEEMLRFDPAAPPPPARSTSALGDLGASFGRGAGALVEGVGTIGGLLTGNMDNPVREFGHDVGEYWQRQKSPGLIAAEQDRAAKVQAADGEWSKFGTALKETVTSPALLASFLAEQAPMTVGPGVAGRAGGALALARGATEKAATKVATGTAIGAGATLQGSDVAGDVYDEALKAAELKGMSPEEAKGAAMEAALKAGVAAGVISVGTQMIPGGATIERALAGGAERIGGRAMGAVKGGVGEMAQEVTEELGGKAAGNIALQKIDPSIETTRGFGETGAMAAIGGGALGATMGAAEPATPPPPAAPPGSVLDGAKGAKTVGEVAADVMAAPDIDAAIVAMAEGALEGKPVATLESEFQQAAGRPMAFPGTPVADATPTPVAGATPAAERAYDEFAPPPPADASVPFDRAGAAALLDPAKTRQNEVDAEAQRPAAPLNPPAIETGEPVPGGGIAVPGSPTTEQQYGDALAKRQRGELLSAYETQLLNNPPAGKQVVAGEDKPESIRSRDPAGMTDKELNMAYKLTRSEARREEIGAEMAKRASQGRPPQAIERTEPLASVAPKSDGGPVKINGERGLLSRNTIPGQRPWRATWFDSSPEDGGVAGHVDLNEREARALLAGRSIEIDRDGSSYYIDPSSSQPLASVAPKKTDAEMRLSEIDRQIGEWKNYLDTGSADGRMEGLFAAARSFGKHPRAFAQQQLDQLQEMRAKGAPKEDTDAVQERGAAPLPAREAPGGGEEVRVGDVAKVEPPRADPPQGADRVGAEEALKVEPDGSKWKIVTAAGDTFRGGIATRIAAQTILDQQKKAGEGSQPAPANTGKPLRNPVREAAPAQEPQAKSATTLPEPQGRDTSEIAKEMDALETAAKSRGEGEPTDHMTAKELQRYETLHAELVDRSRAQREETRRKIEERRGTLAQDARARNEERRQERAAIEKRPTIDEVPPAVMKRVRVTVDQRVDSAEGYETRRVEVPADEALRDLDSEIVAFEKLLKCVEAG